MAFETPEELAQTGHAWIAASGSALRAINNARALQANVETPEEVRQLDELIFWLRDVREQQIEAGEIFRRARAGRAAKGGAR